jgi:glucose-6-phosphate 1-dehydrogenase
MWRIVDPALRESGPVYPYKPGSWGPREADRILGNGDTWFPPSG